MNGLYRPDASVLILLRKDASGRYTTKTQMGVRVIEKLNADFYRLIVLWLDISLKAATMSLPNVDILRSS